MTKSFWVKLAWLCTFTAPCFLVSCTPLASAPLSPEDVPAGAEPITTFNGEWLSTQFSFAFRITSRIGVSTLSNNASTQKGDIVLIITEVDGVKFNGREVFSNGSVQDVIGRLSDPDTLMITGAGLSWSMIRISTPNAPPVVNAGETQTIPGPGLVQLDGTVDDDGEPDGTLSSAWSLVSGPGEVVFDDATAVDTAASLSGVGEYTLQLEASDGELTSTSTVIVIVLDGSTSPVDAGRNRAIVAGLQITLGNSNPNDPNSNATTYLWEQTDGVPVMLSDPTTARPTFVVPADAQTLSFTLTVDDGVSRSTSAPLTLTVRSNPRVRLDTTMGGIVMDILFNDAPLTSLNFLQYVEDGFYAGTVFHRVVPDFIVQGGGFTTDQVLQSGLRDPIPNEYSADRSNVRGTVAMAKVDPDPNSATSQFFFNLADNSQNLDQQNGGFTVFARVIEGMDVVDAMAQVATNSETPVEAIILTRATIE